MIDWLSDLWWKFVLEFDRWTHRDPDKAAKMLLSGWLIAVALLVLLLSGCAYQPVIDKRGVDQTRYAADLVECQAYAEQLAGAGTGAAVGAVAGYALGYGLSHLMRGNQSAEVGRATGVGGALSGAAAAATAKRDAVRTCLRGRGYQVLN